MMSSSSSTSTSPLDKIVFIQRILLFACKNPRQPILLSFVNSAWRETLVSEQFSTAVTIWSRELSGGSSEFVTQIPYSSTSVPLKDSGSIGDELFNFSPSSSRFRPSTWTKTFASISLLMSAAIRQGILWIVKDLHRAGFPQHFPCFASRFSPLTTISDVLDPLNLAILNNRADVVETLLFSEACGFYESFDDMIEEHRKEIDIKIAEVTRLDNGNFGSSHQPITTAPNKQYLSSFLCNAVTEVVNSILIDRLKALSFDDDSTSTNGEENNNNNNNNNNKPERSNRQKKITQKEALNQPDNWEKREVYDALPPSLKIVVLLVLRVKRSHETVKFQMDKINVINNPSAIRTSHDYCGDETDDNDHVDPFCREQSQENEEKNNNTNEEKKEHASSSSTISEDNPVSKLVNAHSSLLREHVTPLYVSAGSEETNSLTRYLMLNGANVGNSFWHQKSAQRWHSPLMVAADNAKSSSSTISRNSSSSVPTFRVMTNFIKETDLLMLRKTSVREKDLVEFVQKYFFAKTPQDGHSFLHQMIVDENDVGVKMFFDFMDELEKEFLVKTDDDDDLMKNEARSHRRFFTSLIDEAISTRGHRAIHLAALSENEVRAFSFLRLLIERGCVDVNILQHQIHARESYAALHLAVNRKEPRLCKYLVEQGARNVPSLPYSSSQRPSKPSDLARRKRLPEVMAFFIVNGFQ